MKGSAITGLSAAPVTGKIIIICFCLIFPRRVGLFFESVDEDSGGELIKVRFGL